MIPKWRDFLSNAGAEFDDGCVDHFGNPPREASLAITGDVFTDLSCFGLVSVHGTDAADFLHGQFTNDVLGIDETHSQLTGYCNPKGRLLAIMRLFRHGDAYYLCLPESLIDSLISRLRMFVLRADVTIDHASDSFVHLGVTGKDIEDTLAGLVPALPNRIGEITRDGDTLVIRVPGIHPSFEIFTGVDTAMHLWDALNVRGAPIGADAWRLMDILSGVPFIYPKTQEAFVPQMVNLQLVDGVNFKKGCYPGQEIVARMQYLGKLKRRMYRVDVNTEQPPQPGDAVYSDRSGDQAAGAIVSAAHHPDGGCAALAVLQIADAAAGDAHLYLGGQGGPDISLGDLPYPIPESTE
jgi:hypothetical protein